MSKDELVPIFSYDSEYISSKTAEINVCIHYT